MNCPACKQPLMTKQENGFLWWAWCAVGPCKSLHANAGACGMTELEAIDTLISELNDHPDWPEN
jgi:hypothetical protein